MRIAISGTHFSGKTTLRDDFIKYFPNYLSIDEPYEELTELGDMHLGLTLGLDDAMAQLEYSIEQFECYLDESDIIFDRCPVDFLVYAICAYEDDENINLYDTAFADILPELQELLSTLDIIVFLPLMDTHEIEYTEENPEYRTKADKYFKHMYRDDAYQLFPNYNKPRIIELSGTPKNRLQHLIDGVGS